MVLRPWRASDADAVFEACQDESIQRWTTVPAPYLAHHAEHYVGTYALHAWDGRTGAAFAVAETADGPVLGSCAFVAVDWDRETGEIGYWIAPGARGRGLAGSAARLLASWGLSHGLQRVEILVEPTNAASRASAASAGARYVGMVAGRATSRDGKPLDMTLYAIEP